MGSDRYNEYQFEKKEKTNVINMMAAIITYQRTSQGRLSSGERSLYFLPLATHSQILMPLAYQTDIKYTTIVGSTAS
jgi:hypothetical protein